jgi:hypothetical protein
MIKTRMMGVTLMTSVIGKKLPRRECRPEHRATDSRRQTRKRRSSLSLALLDLSSRYFLKRSKIDISQNVKFLFVCFERSTQHDCSVMFVVESTEAFCLGASGANRRTSELERGPPRRTSTIPRWQRLPGAR